METVICQGGQSLNCASAQALYWIADIKLMHTHTRLWGSDQVVWDGENVEPTTSLD